MSQEQYLTPKYMRYTRVLQQGARVLQQALQAIRTGQEEVPQQGRALRVHHP
jgi:hypothetical protein